MTCSYCCGERGKMRTVPLLIEHSKLPGRENGWQIFTEIIVLDSQGQEIAKRQSLHSCIHYLLIQQIFIKRFTSARSWAVGRQGE